MIMEGILSGNTLNVLKMYQYHTGIFLNTNKNNKKETKQNKNKNEQKNEFTTK